VAGNLYNRFGAKPLLIFGSACIAIGPGLIALFADKQTLLALVPGMAILGLGIGLFYPTATTVGVTGVEESRRSLAGAIIYMFQIAGGSVGLGLTTTVFIGASDRAQSGSGFVDGIQTAFALDAAIAVGGFLIAAFLIQGRVHAPHLRRLLLAGHSPRGHGP
jgi:MFS family permease